MIDPKDFEGNPDDFEKSDPDDIKFYISTLQKLKRECCGSQKWDAKTNQWINTENEV